MNVFANFCTNLAVAARFTTKFSYMGIDRLKIGDYISRQFVLGTESLSGQAKPGIYHNIEIKCAESNNNELSTT